MRLPPHSEESAWRAFVGIAFTLLTTASAHIAAGGPAPSLDSLSLILPTLLPVGVALYLWGGRPMPLAITLFGGQLLGHWTQSTFSSSHGGPPGIKMGCHSAPTPAQLEEALAGITTPAGLGLDIHSVIPSPAMLSTHLLAVLIATVLVIASTDGLRRSLLRFELLLTPLPEPPSGEMLTLQDRALVPRHRPGWIRIQAPRGPPQTSAALRLVLSSCPKQAEKNVLDVISNTDSSISRIGILACSKKEYKTPSLSI